MLLANNRKVFSPRKRLTTKAFNIRRLQLPTSAWLTLGCLLLVSLFSSNPFPTTAAICTLPILAQLTWRMGEPPVLFFAVFFQWVQVSTTIFYANFLGKNISEYPNPTTTGITIWLSLAGLIILATGMKVGVDWKRTGKLAPSSSVSLRYSMKKIWFFYLFFFILSATLPPLLGQVQQIRTIILGLMLLKWTAFYILSYLAFANGKGFRNKYLLYGLVLEILLGFSGYFSGFKHVFFILAIAMLSTKVRLKSKDMAPLLPIIFTVLFLAICWSSIKVDYRYFLNRGTGQQQVLIPFEQRLSTVVEMTLDLDGHRFLEGADALVRRIAYVEMFARAVDTVPHYLPHEDGRLWLAALKHISMPRLLFPNKPALPSDSELSSKYTRLHMAGAAQGTSISMGYMAESYIDFGMKGMFFPVFFCGLLWGLMYRYFMIKVSARIIAYGIVTALLVNANQFEMHSVKLLGGMVTNFLVLTAVVKFILPKYLNRLTY